MSNLKQKFYAIVNKQEFSNNGSIVLCSAVFACEKHKDITLRRRNNLNIKHVAVEVNRSEFADCCDCCKTQEIYKRSI